MTLKGKQISATTVSIASLAVAFLFQTVTMAFYMGKQNQKLSDVERDTQTLVRLHIRNGAYDEKSRNDFGGVGRFALVSGVYGSSGNRQHARRSVGVRLYNRPNQGNLARSEHNQRLRSVADGSDSGRNYSGLVRSEILLAGCCWCADVLERIDNDNVSDCDVVTDNLKGVQQ